MLRPADFHTSFRQFSTNFLFLEPLFVILLVTQAGFSLRFFHLSANPTLSPPEGGTP
jgi:hypothetical protein